MKMEMDEIFDTRGDKPLTEKEKDAIIYALQDGARNALHDWERKSAGKKQFSSFTPEGSLRLIDPLENKAQFFLNGKWHDCKISDLDLRLKNFLIHPSEPTREP